MEKSGNQSAAAAGERRGKKPPCGQRQSLRRQAGESGTKPIGKTQKRCAGADPAFGKRAGGAGKRKQRADLSAAAV